MTVRTIIDNNTYSLGLGHSSPVTMVFDFGQIVDVKLISMHMLVSSSQTYMYYDAAYSYDNVTFYTVISTIANDAQSHRLLLTDSESNVKPTRFIYFRLTEGTVLNPDAISHFDDITISLNDLVVDSAAFHKVEVWDNMSPEFNQERVFQVGVDLTMSFDHITTIIEGGGGGQITNPTSTNVITGNVRKLSLPFKANVVAVSVSVTPEVVGETVSDEITGDYSIDVYPHTDEVLIYIAPDYGREFSPNLFMSTGQLMHPTIPNQYVYEAQNDGEVGLTEPNWGAGTIASNQVTFLPKPLHKPLINGFVKPVITAI